MKKIIPLLLLLVLVVQQAEAKPLSHPAKIIATFSVLGDFAKQVGGNQVQVYSLVGNDKTTGDYKPNEGDRISVERSDLVISNGLGLEGWLGDLLQRSKEQVRVLQASKGVQVRYAAGGGLDPHAWMDVSNAIIYVRNICADLVAIDPLNAGYYKDNAEAYIYQLKKLDHWVKLQTGRLPRRAFAISHDSLAYFASAYGLSIIPVEGVDMNFNDSASDFPDALAAIRKNKVDLFFSENVGGSRIANEVTALTGVPVVGKLYATALSEDDGATNYIDMMRTDVNTLSAALSPPPSDPGKNPR